MATSQSLHASSIAPSMKPEALTDFVLYEESDYFDSRQFIHQSNPQFHSAPIHSDNYVTSSASRGGVVDWSAMLENPAGLDNNLHTRQQQEAVSKPFYPLDLPPATSSPTFDSYPAYTQYGISESFAGEMPPVLVHPPTFPYPSNIPQDEYRQSPFPSPVTSAGGWDAHSSVTSAISGSEAGSNSPYPNDDVLYTTQYPTATASVNPALISNASPNQLNDDAPVSASSHGSPDWQSAPSPTSNPASPVFNKPPRSVGSVGRLSPYPARERPAPYPARRPSVSSQGSRRSHGSPVGSGNLEWYEDPSGAQGEIFAGQQLQRAASAESHRSRGARAPSSSASVPSSHSGVGSSGKDTVCPECNKSFRDLRAHQLTHQLERPVKCPIATCEYSKKGFARKYDCQRHTLTHYKGTMVCGFCPGSGSAVEKSFNRADVFKRHLMSVHNVEQTPPNGRKKIGSKQGSFAASPTEEDRFSGAYITGKCSICSVTFATAQQFYEHLDECVQLKVVQEEPAAAFNEMNLDSVKLEDMEETSDKGKRVNKGEEEEEDAEEDAEEEDDLVEEGEDGADDGKDETFTPSGRKSTGKLGRNGSKRATRGGAKKPASGNGSGGSRQR